MSGLIKDLARRVFLSDTAQGINQIVWHLSQKEELRQWERARHTIPPPHIVKQRAVKAYAAAFSLHTLIETGTYLGTMIDATKDTFDRIHSIELDRGMYLRAARRYAGLQHISLHHGDSSKVLPEILVGVREACLFWLDAHHSGVLTARGELDSPVMQEIAHILNHPVQGHVLLIDDAHAFLGRGGYPTIAELRNLIATRCPGWVFEVKDDVIRIHPPAGPSPG